MGSDADLRLERKTFEWVECNDGYIQIVNFAEDKGREEVSKSQGGTFLHQIAAANWLLVGAGTGHQLNLAKLLTFSDVGVPGKWNALTSGEFMKADPECAMAQVKALLERNFKVYYTPLALPSLLLHEERAYAIAGSTLREIRGVDADALLRDLRWSLTGKYLKVSGIVESIETCGPVDLYIKLRNHLGYRNVVLGREDGHAINLGDSLDVIALYPIGGGSLPYLEAVSVSKRD